VTFLALETDETLLILKIAFLVLLYGFILLVVRSATRGMEQAPQESIVLGAAEAAALREEHGLERTRLLVIVSPELREGQTIDVVAPMIVGRDAESGIRLDRDEFASGRHARIEPRPNGAWIDDLGSTNGTFLNGTKLKRAKLARAGDVIRIGATELQVQQ
jgi:FHA domain